jgi:(R)-benzylsuccinyl-CoA dehydrogenase
MYAEVKAFLLHRMLAENSKREENLMSIKITEHSEETAMLRKLVRDFTQKELIPLEKTVIEREANRGLGDDPVIPPDIHQRLLQKAKDIGLWGIDVPKEYGGLGLGNYAKAIAVEELSKSIVPFTLPPDAPNLHLLVECCNDKQRERYLLPYARGEKTSNLALTEPNAGSDAGGIQMRAIKKGDKWVLNGTKTFISGAARADFIITLAVTDPEKGKKGGITAFLVDKGTPGLKISRGIPTIGELHPYEIFYDNLELDESQVLGEVGKGFIPLQNRLGVRRMELAIRCVGMAERALKMMVDYAKQRKTFGEYLSDRQAVQWWVADSMTDIHATKLMVYDAAEKMDKGVKDLRKESSMLKIFGTEMATKVLDHAIQAHGGMGLTKDLPLEYMYRQIRIYRIVEGPSEVHRWTLARREFKK